MRFSAACVATMTLICCFTCHAWERPTLLGERPIYENDVDCAIYPKYTVLTQTKEGELGAKIIVQSTHDLKSKPNNCKLDKKKVNSFCEIGEACYFFGLYHNLIIIDDGTSASHGLSVFDVDTKKQVYDATYSGEIAPKGDSIISFYKNEVDRENPNGKVCKSGQIMATEIVLDLNKIIERRTGKHRCEMEE